MIESRQSPRILAERAKAIEESKQKLDEQLHHGEILGQNLPTPKLPPLNADLVDSINPELTEQKLHNPRLDEKESRVKLKKIKPTS